MKLLCLITGAFLVGFVIPELASRGREVPLGQNLLSAIGCALLAYGVMG